MFVCVNSWVISGVSIVVIIPICGVSLRPVLRIALCKYLSTIELVPTLFELYDDFTEKSEID